jgi:RNA polymerase sigma-70 factor (ECF subfamily)
MSANEDLKILMLAGLQGDAVSYRRLLDKLGGQLRAYYKGRLGRIGRSSSEAEDLLQEALLAIHTRRHTYDMTEPFAPWVYAIARYKLIDHLRHSKNSMLELPIGAAAAVLAIADDHARAESALDIQRLLAGLPEKMRQTIRHVKLDGLSVAETAHRCGISESDVKVSLHRGLKRLRRRPPRRAADEDRSID